MKHLLIFAYAILFYINISAQTQTVNFVYFNKVYGGSDTINILATSCVPLSDSTYMVIGNYTLSGSYAAYTMLLNSIGDITSIKQFDNSVVTNDLGTIDWGARVLKYDNSVMIAYEKWYPNPYQYDIKLAKIDFTGDTIWVKRYSQAGRQYALQIIPIPNNGYMIAGMEGVVTNDTVKAYALKIDSMGNYEWDKRYLMGNDARFFSVQHTPWDGGYIFGGMGYSTTTGYDMFVVKTLANGDTLWTKRYGNEFSNCAALVIPFISYEEYLNGAEVEYIMTSCWHDSSNPWQSKNYIAKINSIGNIVWEKKHTNYAPFASLQTFPYITPDKHIVGAAAYYQSGNWSPVVISYNSNGTIEWSKPFTINSQKDCYIKDLQPTPDGGYVLAGYQFTAPQTAWVLKIDAQGSTCSYVGCDSTVTIIVHTTPPFSEETPALVSAHTYPNPAAAYLYISYTLPQQYALQGGALWHLYDALGRQWAQVPLSGSAGTATADVSHLPPGLYFYRVQLPASGQTVASGKVVVGK